MNNIYEAICDRAANRQLANRFALDLRIRDLATKNNFFEDVKYLRHAFETIERSTDDVNRSKPTQLIFTPRSKRT